MNNSVDCWQVRINIKEILLVFHLSFSSGLSTVDISTSNGKLTCDLEEGIIVMICMHACIHSLPLCLIIIIFIDIDCCTVSEYHYISFFHF